MKIINKEIKFVDGSYVAYFYVDQQLTYEWWEAYNRALKALGSFATIYGTGCPTIDNLHLENFVIYTNNFPEIAKYDFPNFLDELQKLINGMNNQYAQIQEEKMKVKARKDEEDAKNQKVLNELNDCLNK